MTIDIPINDYYNTEMLEPDSLFFFDQIVGGGGGT